ncbi:MAG: DEAD/DEAH box helicase family protein [bacterium]|nr:DEAD/DEAH box helicase family protein [bacterium]MDT8367027.1 DEAD/DEAH box helicase family protein [bacterium]
MSCVALDILNYEDIRTRANDFLASYHPDRSLPIPIEKIIGYQFGINIYPIPGLKRLLGEAEVEGFLSQVVDIRMYKDGLISKSNFNLPGSDEGIDLLAQTKEGDYWAIQCKYREDESHSLTRKELSTFTDLAFSICKGIDLALVCTSADRFSHKLKMYGDRLTFCTGDEWRRLDTEFFSTLRKHLAGQKSPLNPLKPRKHQESAVENALQHFKIEKNARGKMIMPCGTGKSLTGYWIAEKLGARSVLVAVPSLALIKQTLEVWTRESVANGTEVNWICICSDETVKDVGGDDASVFVQDLGVHVHTDPEEIAGWLKRKKTGRTVVFTTYQSGKAIAEASRLSGTVFDLGIMDEAHKTVGRKDSTFAWLLSDENIRIKKRAFMTATERRYAGSSDQLVSMDDPETYGDTFELLSHCCPVKWFV